jgi:alcohol sulfotransferase
MALFGHVPVIFLVRDPRDVMVSAYFHETRHKRRFNGTVSEFLASPLGLSRMIDYLNGWAAGLARHPHLLLSYEKLSADPASESARVLGFLGVPVDPALLDQAIAAASFDRMRALELKDGIPAHSYDRTDPQSLRMRKGKVGSFTDLLTEADIACIADGCATRLTQQARGLFA